MPSVDVHAGSTATIDDIVVQDRFRRDLGDLSELMASIDGLGLLHPIVVTPDLRLVAGQRRLEAMRRLGAIEVPVTVVADLEAASSLLAAERDENTCRKPMTASELYALGKALEELERPKAAARMSEGGRAAAPGRPAERSGRATGPLETREVVGDSLGMSGVGWQRLKHIGDRVADEADTEATQVLEDIDRGTETIYGGYSRLRARDLGKKAGLPTTSPTDLGNVGDKRSVPRRKGPEQQLRQLADKVKGLGNLARMIDLEGLTKQEADDIVVGLSEGLSALTSLKNQLRKVR